LANSAGAGGGADVFFEQAGEMSVSIEKMAMPARKVSAEERI
jgi:hypothetical protein